MLQKVWKNSSNFRAFYFETVLSNAVNQQNKDNRNIFAEKKRFTLTGSIAENVHFWLEFSMRLYDEQIRTNELVSTHLCCFNRMYTCIYAKSLCTKENVVVSSFLLTCSSSP